MRTTTSPGIRREREKTMTVAMRREGIATSRRLSAYFRIMPGIEAGRVRAPGPCSADRLLVPPGRHEPAAVVVAEVRPEVLELGIERGDVHARRHPDVVHLLGDVPLDIEDLLAALLLVERAARV